MNLAYHYPSILWNTSRLLVESDSTENLELNFIEDEETEVEKSSVNYFKLASAIGAVRKQGVQIEKPNINKSGFVFKPVIEENKIYFGLSGIAGIGAQYVDELMEKRPFSSPEDVLDRTSLNRLQVINLIKAGCFEEIENISRQELVKRFCAYVADTKTNLNMQNMGMLTRLGLFPQSLSFEVNLWKIKEFLNKHCKFGTFYVPQEDMWQYIEQYDIEPLLSEDGEPYFEKAKFDAFVTKTLLPVKKYIADNKEILLQQVNSIAIQEMLDKYWQTEEEGELKALSFYYGQSVLKTEPYASFIQTLYAQRTFESLNEEPIIEWQNEEGAKKFELTRIAVSAIGRDRQKCIIGCLDSEGNFFQAKVNKNTFKKYDKQITDEGGKHPSWFSKGSHLILTGYRNGDIFTVKSYKNSAPSITKIEDYNGEIIALTDR